MIEIFRCWNEFVVIVTSEDDMEVIGGGDMVPSDDHKRRYQRGYFVFKNPMSQDTQLLFDDIYSDITSCIIDACKSYPGSWHDSQVPSSA